MKKWLQCCKYRLQEVVLLTGLKGPLSGSNQGSLFTADQFMQLGDAWWASGKSRRFKATWKLVQVRYRCKYICADTGNHQEYLEDQINVMQLFYRLPTPPSSLNKPLYIFTDAAPHMTHTYMTHTHMTLTHMALTHMTCTHMTRVHIARTHMTHVHMTRTHESHKMQTCNSQEAKGCRKFAVMG